MFDDQQISRTGPGAPNNLPFQEPPDMFDGAENNASLPPVEQFSTPVDFSPQPASASALGAGILQPKTGEVTPFSVKRDQSFAPNQNPQTPPGMNSLPPQNGQEPLNAVKQPTLSHGIMIAIMIVIVGFILAGSGWFVYRIFNKPSSDSTNNVSQPEIQNLPPASDETVDIPVALPPVDEIQEVSSNAVDEEIILGEMSDTDSDGIKDNREREIGTDPNNADSDMDGLLDGEELLIWRTNPKNIDTDGDGYKDGDEVKAGYNPSGPGRLSERVLPPSFAENVSPSLTTNTVVTAPTSTVFEPSTASSTPVTTTPVFEIEL